MKFLCADLYFQVKTLLLLIFKRALLSVCNVTLEELLLLAEQSSSTVVALKKSRFIKQGLKNELSSNASGSSEFQKLSGKGDTHVYVYMFIKKFC